MKYVIKNCQKWTVITGGMEKLNVYMCNACLKDNSLL